MPAHTASEPRSLAEQLAPKTSPFSKAVYPWEHAQWGESDASLAQAYLAESRIHELGLRAAQVQLSAQDFLTRCSARAIFSDDQELPSWWQWLCAAEAAGLKLSRLEGVGDAEFALLGLFESELAYALSLLEQEFELKFGAAIAPHLVSLCVPGLLKRIWSLAHPALLLELKLARQQQQLKAATPNLRFMEFCAQLKSVRRDALQELYPLLWRDVASFCMSHQIRRCELFGDIQRHADELSARFEFPVSLAHLCTIKSDVADLHNGGRSTLILCFSEQSNSDQSIGSDPRPKVCVYKPRNLCIESSFLEFYRTSLSAFGRRIELPHFVHGQEGDRNYGFMQFVVHRKLGDSDTPAEYAWRLGALLALAEALLGNDFHYENIIADGATPIPIDLETLFQPLMRAELGGEQPGDLMRLTPFRVGVLPRTHAGASTEFSALFANEGKTYQATDLVDVGTDAMRLERFERHRNSVDSHLPRSDLGAHALLSEHHALEQGWTAVRHYLEQHWETLTAPSGAVAELSKWPVRLIARATQHYHMITSAICAPRYLQCTAKRLALIDRLWQGFEPSHQDGKRFQSEVEAIARNEIPYFFGMPRERALRAEQVCVDEAFPESAWNQVLARAASVRSDFKRARAALRTAFVVSLEHDHRLRKLPISRGVAFTTQRRRDGWQRVLRNVAELLAQRRYQDHQQTGWLGFAASQKGFAIRFTSLDLYAGLAGIGLSFARLAASEFGRPLDRRIAEDCFASIAFRLESNPLALTQVGFAGAGGVLYGASMASAILHGRAFGSTAFEQIQQRCLNFLKLARLGPQVPQEMDVIGGAAGALLGICAAWQNNAGNSQSLREEIIGWVGTIMKHANPTSLDQHQARTEPARDAQSTSAEQGLAWQSTSFPTMLTGMAHGACGIAIALSKARDCLPANEMPTLETLQAALRFETNFIQSPEPIWRDARYGIVEDAEECCMAWCHGAPGLLMARLQIADPSLDAKAFSVQLERVIAEGFEQDWVLCHGALGQLMILRRMMKSGRLSTLQFAELESAVLDAWERAWPVLSEQAVQPGLFDGLTGAIYCALDMLDVRPELDLLAYATRLESHDEQTNNDALRTQSQSPLL